MDLAGQLHRAGARLVLADIHTPTLEDAVARFGAEAIDADHAHAAEVDVFAPCALGAGLNDDTIPQIRAGIVAGAANNQLAEERHDEALRQRGILYAPDYAINAGGVISIALATPGGDDALVRRKVEAIDGTLTRIFERAERLSLPTQTVADTLAEERLAAA